MIIKKNMFSPTIFVTFLLFLPYSLFSDKVQNGAANTGFQLLEEPLNPRFIAMGSAGTALAGKGFSYYNPALPYLLHKTYIGVSFGRYIQGDLNRFHLETSFPLKNWFIGLSPRTESIDNIYRTYWDGKPPDMNLPSSAQFTHIALNIGYSRWDNFAIAVCINGMQDRIMDYTAYAMTSSIGVIYKPVPEKLTIGLSLLNAGFSTLMSDTAWDWGKGDNLPLTSRLGIAWSDTITRLGTMPFTVAFDIVYRDVRSRDHGFRRYISDRFTFPAGLEIQPLECVSLRVGKRFNHPTEIINLGMGMKLDPFAFDVSFVIPKLVDDAELKWLTNITFFLSRKQGNKNKITSTPAIGSEIESGPVLSDSSHTGQTSHDQTGSSTAQQDSSVLRIENVLPDSVVSDSLQNHWSGEDIRIQEKDVSDSTQLDVDQTDESEREEPENAQTFDNDTLDQVSDTLSGDDLIIQDKQEEVINLEDSDTTVIIESIDIDSESIP